MKFEITNAKGFRALEFIGGRIVRIINRMGFDGPLILLEANGWQVIYLVQF